MNQIPPNQITVSYYTNAKDNKGDLITIERIVDRIASDQYLIDQTKAYRESFLPPIAATLIPFMQKRGQYPEKWNWIVEARERKKKTKKNTPEWLNVIHQIELQEADSECQQIFMVEAIYKSKCDAADDFKTTHFPAVTWSGIFKKRAINALSKHSGLQVIDIDNLTDREHMAALKSELQKDPYVFFLFTSPSDEGLKPIIKIPNDASTHLEYLNSIFLYLSDKYGLTIGKGQMLDPSGKDVSRLCFLCADADFYFNSDSRLYDLIDQYKPAEKEKKPTTRLTNNQQQRLHGTTETANDVYEFTQNISQDIEGNRNDFLMLYGCNCYRKGISETDATEHALQFSTLPENEILATMRSAYDKKRHTRKVGEEDIDDFGRYAAKPGKPKITVANDATPDMPAAEKSKPVYSHNSHPLWDTPANVKKNTNDRQASQNSEFIQFWDYIEKVGRDEKVTKSFAIDYNKLKQFLSAQGFYRLRLDNSTYQFIRIVNNRVKPVAPLDIKDFIFDYLEENGHYDVTNNLTRGGKQFLSIDKFERLPYRYVDVKRHTEHQAFFYYQNGMVTVTPDNITLTPYSEIGDVFIWDRSVNARTVQVLADEREDTTDFPEELTKSEIYRFCWTACCNDKNLPEDATDSDRIKWNQGHVGKFAALCTSIGYLLHQYKTPSKAKAIVAIDHQIPNDYGEQNGGTGKSIIGKYMLSHMLNVATIPGKDYRDDNPWRWEPINIDSQVVFFNDAKRNFNFEGIFELVTDDMLINRRTIGYLNIPFSQSPKIYIATNFIPKGEGSSFRRRMHVIEFDNYYNDSHSPFDEFGHNLFQDWKGDYAGQWNLYDNFVFRCVQMYLQDDLQNYPHGNYDARKLVSECPQEFIDWMDAADENGKAVNVKKDDWIVKKTLFTAWTLEAKGFNLQTPTAHAFTKMVKKYCITRAVAFTSVKTAGVEYYCFGKPPTTSPSTTQGSLL